MRKIGIFFYLKIISIKIGDINFQGKINLKCNLCSKTEFKLNLKIFIFYDYELSVNPYYIIEIIDNSMTSFLIYKFSNYESIDCNKKLKIFNNLILTIIFEFVKDIKKILFL